MVEAVLIILGVVIFIVLVLILWLIASYKAADHKKQQHLNDDPNLTYIRAEVYVETFSEPDKKHGEKK